MAFEGYRLERRAGRWCVIDPDTGAVESTWPSRPAAVEHIVALDPELRRRQAEARAARDHDPEVLRRRAERGAYRAAKPGTLVHALAKVLPRNGDIARATDEAQRRALAWLDGQLQSAASDPAVHKKLQRKPAQRRVGAAVEQRQRARAAKVAQATTLRAQGMSRKEVARRLDVSPEHVSRLLRKKK